MRQRAQLIAHIRNTNSQYNRPPFEKNLPYKGNRCGAIADRFEHPGTGLSVAADLGPIASYDAQVAALERHLVKAAKVDDPATYQFLRTVPGVGEVLGRVLLYELDAIRRFPEVGNSASYARLVVGKHESNGRVKGAGGREVGNAHLKWAFSEAASLMLRSFAPARAWVQKQSKERGKKKARAILEAKIGRAVYHLWKKQVAFDAGKFLAS